MRPTIQQVAEKAGVSTATVSRFLNGSTHVSEGTAAKVRRAIDELGYLPNASARSLTMRETGTISLVFPQLSGPFFSELIRGAESGAHETGHHLLIYGASGQAGQEDRTLQLLATKADGLILANPQIERRYIQHLLRQRVPVVLLGRRPQGMVVDSLMPDNVGGAHRAVTHLIDHGYSRIAMIEGPSNQPHARDRKRGYLEALSAHGLFYDTHLALAGGFDEASGYQSMTELLGRKPLPDAVFAANDQMAIGAIAAVHESGLSMPEDLAMIGFDDIRPARYLQPALTTVRQDLYGQGQLAVEMLVARINDPERQVETRLLQTELVLRRSCGCPAPGGRSA